MMERIEGLLGERTPAPQLEAVSWLGYARILFEKGVLMSEYTFQFKHLTKEELHELFTRAVKNDEGNAFFNSFEYRKSLSAGNYSGTLNFGMNLLNQCKAIDETGYQEIHKGSAFYWIGMAAYLMNDYQTATFFFDAAVSEDLRRGHHPEENPSPSFRYILIEGEASDQAARGLVQDAQARIESLIEIYNQIPGRDEVIDPLDISILRAKFFRPSLEPDNEHWRSLASTFISFILEWNFRNSLLDLRMEPGTIEPFYIHLFKGCVLFESILKANPSNHPPEGALTLINVLQHLRNDLGIPNDMSIGETDFPTILNDIGENSIDIVSAIELTGKVRNSIGHNLGWRIDLTKEQNQALFSLIAISNLHAINCLY